MKGSIVDTYREPIKIVVVITPNDCNDGICDCVSASECKFTRCENCDNMLHAITDRAYFQCQDEIYACPDCGGDTR